MSYPVIRTDRLILRQWKYSDIADYCLMNQDPRVMEFFPSMPSPEESTQGIHRYARSIDAFGYGYFATELVETGAFIGFIGFMDQIYESPFTPAIDIGWRLEPKSWGKGLATEGAEAALKYARKSCKIDDIISVATKNNLPSHRVMEKIGMHYIGEFGHPKIPSDSPLHTCVVYK